jgi:hypothetical protein
VAPATSTANARLQDAGAVRLGALHMAEFAYGPTGHNEHLTRLRLRPTSCIECLPHIADGMVRLSAHSTRRLKSPLGSPNGPRLPLGDIATPRHSPSRSAPTTKRKLCLMRLMHHCLREMSLARVRSILSAIKKLDSSAAYSVQSRTLALRSTDAS